MTNPTPHGQVPEALQLAKEIMELMCSNEAAARRIAAAADELCRLHAENERLAALVEAQQPAPSAAHGVADAMADSQYLAGVSAGWNAANADDPNAALQKLHESRTGYLKPLSAARAPADSVTAPAGGADWQDISTAPKDGTRFVAVGQNYGLDSEAQHTCIAQWLAGCWVEVSDWNGASKLKYLTYWMPLPPLPCSAARAPADSVLEDAARLDWLLLRISGAEFRRLGVHYSGNARRADVDAARKQGVSHDR